VLARLVIGIRGSLELSPLEGGGPALKRRRTLGRRIAA